MKPHLRTLPDKLDPQGEGSATSVQQPQTEVRDEPAKPGSLLEQIQDEVDAAEPIPVPIPEPLDPQPQ